jgi:NAD-dependent deacetylase
MNRRKIIIFCGSGISTSSGIPTYRSDTGMWLGNDVKQIAYKGCEMKEESIDFYNNFRELLQKCEPSIVHKTIKKIQELYGAEFVKIYTMNIDNLLEQAGCKNVIHLHGDITKIKCVNCNTKQYQGCEQYFLSKVCSKCKHIMVNDVVFFNDKADYEGIINDVFDLKREDIFLLLGTSGKVFNISELIKPFEFMKILGNLERSEYIDDSKFLTYFGKLELRIKQIEDFLFLIKEYE